MKLSEKIYYYRKKMGKSQEGLAEELGVSRQAVSKWETGESEPELAKLRALATAFGVTVDALLSEDAPAPDAPAADNVAPSRENENARTWVDALPGALGRLVSRYGWLGGVYLAVVGGITALMGIAIFLIAGSMTANLNETITNIGGMGMTATPSVPTGVYTPMYVMGGLFLVIGLGLAITGIIIAVKLKKNQK